jgi:hypothetical protein
MTAPTRSDCTSPTPQGRAQGVVTTLVDAAAILAVWGALLLAETVALGFLWREQFSGVWEIARTRHVVVPIAIVALAPLSLVVVAGWRVARKAASGEHAAARVLAVTGAVAAGAIAIGVSGGRHFASWVVRAPFVFALVALGSVGGARGVPRITTFTRQPSLLAALGLVITIATWFADGYVLPRLYPTFHAAMLAGSLMGSALIGIALRVGATPSRTERWLAAVVGGAVVCSAAWAPSAVRRLDSATNLRFALVEHAPLLGAAVVIATYLCPPAADDDTSAAPNAASPKLEGAPPGEVARSLDWTDSDLILLTVDALRADHVSSYGYWRTTTPSIDALAHEGTLFESAYCPTPHTSYSLTSMLTGKYLRPLLALGLGEDSETWPQALRRYGWRTAAFYPPAVFFIDEDSFGRFEGEQLGFEYAKVEFASAALREKQVAEYLEQATPDVPLFLWVHLFEPHEPYVVHPEHVFSGGASPDVDAYDSEVAAADAGIGGIVRLVRARRRNAVVIVTADHGEEFGEHGGHYHGTTVYEEQVHVPLVMAGQGIRKGGRVATVVQTIDLLPTALSGLGIPRPARLRGRDLGPLLATDTRGTTDGGFAFAETDDYALVASGDERLVCARRAAACAVYRPRDDPRERSDVGGDEPERLSALRAMLRGVERDHGRYEASASAAWPEALRRGMQGEADTAMDVASLLDDADVAIRRKAAELCFRFKDQATVPAVERAFARDDDDEVHRWAALALVRMGEPVTAFADALLKDPSRDWRRRAALTLAERGESGACAEISEWWVDALPQPGRRTSDAEPPRLSLDLRHAEELLAATGKARCRTAVPALVQALDDVRVRPYVADALGAIGDDRARARLLAVFVDEPYVTARPHEARALIALGARDWWTDGAAPRVNAVLAAPARGGALRLLVLLSDASAALEGSVDGVPFAASPTGNEVRALDLPACSGRRVQLDLRASSGGVVAAWLASTDLIDRPLSRK